MQKVIPSKDCVDVMYRPSTPIPTSMVNAVSVFKLRKYLQETGWDVVRAKPEVDKVTTQLQPYNGQWYYASPPFQYLPLSRRYADRNSSVLELIELSAAIQGRPVEAVFRDLEVVRRDVRVTRRVVKQEVEDYDYEGNLTSQYVNVEQVQVFIEGHLEYTGTVEEANAHQYTHDRRQSEQYDEGLFHTVAPYAPVYRIPNDPSISRDVQMVTYVGNPDYPEVLPGKTEVHLTLPKSYQPLQETGGVALLYSEETGSRFLVEGVYPASDEVVRIGKILAVESQV